MIRSGDIHKLFLLLLLGIFASCDTGQQIKSEIDKAHEVLDKGLEKAQSDEYEEYHKKLDSSVIKQESILNYLRTSGDEDAIILSNQVIQLTTEIEAKIDSIRMKLEKTYTLDENAEFNNKRDLSGVKKIMIDDENGKQLRMLLERNSKKLREEFSTRKFDLGDLELEIEEALKTPKKETWEEFNFKQMPVVAVTPLLRKYKNDAIVTRLDLLAYLKAEIEE